MYVYIVFYEIVFYEICIHILSCEKFKEVSK